MSQTPKTALGHVCHRGQCPIAGILRPGPCGAPLDRAMGRFLWVGTLTHPPPQDCLVISVSHLHGAYNRFPVVVRKWPLGQTHQGFKPCLLQGSRAKHLAPPTSSNKLAPNTLTWVKDISFHPLQKGLGLPSPELEYQVLGCCHTPKEASRSTSQPGSSRGSQA